MHSVQIETEIERETEIETETETLHTPYTYKTIWL